LRGGERLELKELIRSIDILEFLSQYTDFEEKNGEYWALSPLKEEKTPSFSVRRESNTFYDFSSGIGGNVFTFVKHFHHCSSGEAVKILEKYAGKTCDSTVSQKSAVAEVARRFRPPKTETKTSKACVLPADYMSRYEKNEDKLSVWEAEGISRASMDKFQVFYDSFSDRIVYPIRNLDGQIINVSGRTLDPDYKAKKLRKYTYFQPLGVLDTIYGLSENMDVIRYMDEIVLFEGAKSVMKADTWGIDNTGAILTSHLNQLQVKILAKLGCRVVFALDKDVNVLLDHNIQRLKRYVRVEYIVDRDGLLDEKDSPVDQGKEIFQKLYDERVPLR
jgi:DNA primase